MVGSPAVLYLEIVMNKNNKPKNGSGDERIHIELPTTLCERISELSNMPGIPERDLVIAVLREWVEKMERKAKRQRNKMLRMMKEDS